MSAPVTGVHLIAAERARQIKDEGWDHGHDSEHEDGELAIAAACYAIVNADAVTSKGFLDELWGMLWPSTNWSIKWWKPKDPLRNLVRAGALIAAEIDRRLKLGERMVPRRGEVEELILHLLREKDGTPRKKVTFCTKPLKVDGHSGLVECCDCDACEAFDALTALVVD